MMSNVHITRQTVSLDLLQCVTALKLKCPTSCILIPFTTVFFYKELFCCVMWADEEVVCQLGCLIFSLHLTQRVLLIIDYHITCKRSTKDLRVKKTAEFNFDEVVSCEVASYHVWVGVRQNCFIPALQVLMHINASALIMCTSTWQMLDKVKGQNFT
jgi:hypothetical protein